ncbi:restriction endonuclease subunit S [Rickettsiales bacterium]|nr:restriction endonuclease subunit S [Rickettsiales bacterium]
MLENNFLTKLLDGQKVEWKSLGEVCEVKNGYTPSKNKSEFWERGTVPWFRMEDIRTNGRVLENSIQHVTSAAVKSGKLFPRNSIIISTTATIGEHALITEEFLCNQQLTVLSIKEQCKEYLSYKYLFYYSFIIGDFCRKIVNPNGFALIGTTKIRTLQIPIPCPENPAKSLEIQQKIVTILDKFTQLTTQLAAELQNRKKQYSYYRDKLLTFNDDEVEWKSLGEVCNVQRGASPRPIVKFITNDASGIPWIKIGDTKPYSKYISNTKQLITLEGAKKSRILNKGDFVISNSMSFGRPYILNIQGAIHDGWASINKFEKTFNSDYLYHYLSSNAVQNHWKNKINSGSVSNLNADIIKSLPVPIPPLSRQKEIVTILDKFDSLTNSISEGLPREIELRQKQYEYYRDLLLNFPKEE